MHSALPLYMQIAESLLDQIEAGKLKPGDRLKPERVLSEQFGVTRATVRKALQSLEHGGLVSRHQGKGTFVRSQRIERQASKLVPFTRGMQHRGYSISAKQISLREIPADYSRSKDLQISLGAVFHG